MIISNYKKTQIHINYAIKTLVILYSSVKMKSNQDKKVAISGLERFLTTPSSQKPTTLTPRGEHHVGSSRMPMVEPPSDDNNSEETPVDNLSSVELESEEENKGSIHDSSRMAKLISFTDSHNNLTQTCIKTLQRTNEENSVGDLVNYGSFDEKAGTLHFLKHRNSSENDSEYDSSQSEGKEICSGDNPILSVTTTKPKPVQHPTDISQKESRLSINTKSQFTIHEEHRVPPLTPALEEDSELSIGKSIDKQTMDGEVVFNATAVKPFITAVKVESEISQNRAATFIQLFYRHRIALKRMREAKLLEENRKVALRQRVAARKIQSGFKKYVSKKREENEKLLAKYISHCATLIQKIYRGHYMRKRYVTTVKHRFKLWRLRRALLIGWKVRCILKCRKIEMIKVAILQLEGQVELRKKKVTDLITMIKILYRTGDWTKSYVRKDLKAVMGEADNKVSSLEPIRETIKEDQFSRILELQESSISEIEDEELSSDPHNNCVKYAEVVRKNPIRNFLKTPSTERPVKMKSNIISQEEETPPPKSAPSKTKKPYLKRKQVYDPKKSIDTAKRTGHFNSTYFYQIVQKSQTENRKGKQTREFSQERDEPRTELVRKIALRGESEAPATGQHKISLFGVKSTHDRDTPSVPPQGKANMKESPPEKSPKQFLKRRTKRVEPAKVDWANVGRRIDCWNPKKQRRNCSQKDRKQVINLKVIHPAQPPQQAPKSEKKNPASAKLFVKRNRTVAEEPEVPKLSEKRSNPKYIVKSTKEGKAPASKKERMGVTELIELYEKYHEGSERIESDFGKRKKEEKSRIPTLTPNAQFFESCTKSYEVLSVLNCIIENINNAKRRVQAAMHIQQAVTKLRQLLFCYQHFLCV
eukprot:TRINITY_DN521_c0_g1_i1.p1 TRINITY_DN521_c0_g1~~TRINITY_DN521_c0_g1_i1.p1  ORF type:complete len:874 (+),score=70.88 TRINITY_DN521_c0_g1_i1:3561-6182(+)